jgi:hypothetical protein
MCELYIDTNNRSLVSLGTERTLVEFGRANLIDKAHQQPDQVKQVVDRIKADGLPPTLEVVFIKLRFPLPLEYCNVGKVISVGKGVTEFSVGDRGHLEWESYGMMTGYDFNLVDMVRELTDVPITALGGASNLNDIKLLIERYKIIGAAAGSIFFFKGKYKAVLITYPTKEEKKLLL